MNFVFTGFMGSGKTAVGKAVAKKLNRRFFDTDELVEKSAGMPISRIFEQYGEETFRSMEREAVEAACENTDVVIACGGGAVLNPKNVEKLSKNGIIICLTASPEKIFERIKDDTARPLLQCPDPLEKIKSLLKERSGAYSVCDFSFDTSNMSAAKAAEEVLTYLESWNKKE